MERFELRFCTEVVLVAKNIISLPLEGGGTAIAVTEGVFTKQVERRDLNSGFAPR